MEFSILTLIDITETGSHRGPDKLAVSQQANFNTLIQVIGLRVNPMPKRVNTHEKNIDKLGFGSKYKGKQKYWEFVFEIDYGETSVEILEDDFHLVPFIKELENTANFEPAVFDTKSEERKNIVFEKLY